MSLCAVLCSIHKITAVFKLCHKAAIAQGSFYIEPPKDCSMTIQISRMEDSGWIWVSLAYMKAVVVLTALQEQRAQNRLAKTYVHLLQLLGELLLDRTNTRIMMKYVTDPDNLKLMMILLKDSSRSIQFEAFHVFKV